jgi:hypothetical protein
MAEAKGEERASGDRPTRFATVRKRVARGRGIGILYDRMT